MFEDIIEILLKNRENLNADKEKELSELMANLDQKYVEREEKIKRMLNEAGYVEPAEEVVDEAAENTTQGWV